MSVLQFASPPPRSRRLQPLPNPALDTRGVKCARTAPSEHPAEIVPLHRRGRGGQAKALARLEDPAEIAALRQQQRGGQTKALARSYDAIGEPDRAARVRSCGGVSVYVCQDGCGQLAGRHAYHCRERLCVYCARARAAALGDALLPLVQGMARPWFVTLTVKNRRDLAECAAHLRAAFKKLRRRAWWKANVVGGIAVEEVTHNAQSGEWHPHLHLVIDAALPQVVLQGKLAELWAAVTGDSHIVDVRPFRGAEGAYTLREFCKYTAKIGAIVEWPLLVRAYIDYARRRRLIVTFGSCYGSGAEEVLAAAEAEQPTQERTDVEQQPCPSCGVVGMLRHDPTRRWRMDAVIAIGGGWYVPGRTVEEHRRVRRDRARAPVARGSVW